MSCCLRSVRGVEASTGRDRVVGRPRPGKDVTKTFIIRGDIAEFVYESSLGVVDNGQNCVLCKIVVTEMIAYRRGTSRDLRL